MRIFLKIIFHANIVMSPVLSLSNRLVENYVVDTLRERASIEFNNGR